MPFQFNGELGAAVANTDIELATGVEGRLEAYLENVAGTLTGVTADLGISGGGTTGTVSVAFAPSELSSATVATDDKIVIADTNDSDNPKTVTVSSVVALAPQGDITAITAGTGISGGGTTGDVSVAFAPSELSSVTVASDDKVVIADTSDSDNPKTVTTSAIAGLVTDISGNAATATALQTARTIGGVSFDGTANIDLAGVNTAGNQNTSGNAATATALATARAINGVDFDGTGDITVTAAADTLTGTELKSTVVTSSLTSVGTLSSLTVSGAITPATVTASTVTVAADDLVLIADTSDSNNIKKVTAQSIGNLGGGGGGGSPAGSDHQVQWNDNGSFGADSGLTYDGTTFGITAIAKITGSAAILRLNNTSSATTGGYVGYYTSDNTRIGYVGYPANDDLYMKNEAADGNIYFNVVGDKSMFWAIENTTEMTLTSARLQPHTDKGLSLGNASNRWNVLYVNEIEADSGSATDPSYTFNGDENTGMYSGGANVVRITTAGTIRTLWSSSGTYLRTPSGYSSGISTLYRTNSTGYIVHFSSSERYKTDIVDMPAEQWQKIYDLRPVKFNWDVNSDINIPDENDVEGFGLIAEEVAEVYPKLVHTTPIEEDNEGNTSGEQIEGVNYEMLTPYLLAAVQDINTRLSTLEDT